jgi:hypothetical protein
MRMRPIGYYVHHHGAGHLARARVIRNALRCPVVLLGTSVGDEGVALDDDRPVDRSATRDDSARWPDALHYAPLDHPGIRRRVATMARWISDAAPSLMIVDVSVEVAMLARLASVPVLYVRLAGKRTDPAHLEAFRGARALIAPYPQQFEVADTPDWVRDKTFYCPGLTAEPQQHANEGGPVLVVAGRGGDAFDGEQLADAARTCSHVQWRAIGPVTPPRNCPSNLTLVGWSDRADQEIWAASIVVGAAGDGLVTAVLAAEKPFICIPQSRPFDEQIATAAGLDRARAAIVRSVWPLSSEWPDLIDAAIRIDPKRQRALSDPKGARKLARWIEGLAGINRPDMVAA